VLVCLGGITENSENIIDTRIISQINRVWKKK